jgi:hypothetical protein
MRRAGSVLLVQLAADGSLRDAARHLGIPTGPSQHSFGPELARWLRFTSAPNQTMARHVPVSGSICP